jgi:hypothetical protein
MWFAHAIATAPLCAQSRNRAPIRRVNLRHSRDGAGSPHRAERAPAKEIAMPNRNDASHRLHRLLPMAVLALGLSLALSACASPRPAAEMASSAEQAAAGQPASEPATPTQPTPMPAAPTCNAEAAKSAIGKTADDATVERARTAAGGHTVRVLKPGQIITKEYMDGRVNLHVDEKNVIVDVGCG